MLNNYEEVSCIEVERDIDKKILDTVLPMSMPDPKFIGSIMNDLPDSFGYKKNFAIITNALRQKGLRPKVLAFKIDHHKDKFVQHYMETYLTERHKVIMAKNEIIKNSEKVNIINRINRGLFLTELTAYFSYVFLEDSRKACEEAYFGKIGIFKYNSPFAREYYLSTGKAPYEIV